MALARSTFVTAAYEALYLNVLRALFDLLTTASLALLRILADVQEGAQRSLSIDTMFDKVCQIENLFGARANRS